MILDFENKLSILFSISSIFSKSSFISYDGSTNTKQFLSLLILLKIKLNPSACKILVLVYLFKFFLIIHIHSCVVHKKIIYLFY